MDMKKLRSYQELLSHREHYLRLLGSGRVKREARSVIRTHIDKLTHTLNERWPNSDLANAS